MPHLVLVVPGNDEIHPTMLRNNQDFTRAGPAADRGLLPNVTTAEESKRRLRKARAMGARRIRYRELLSASTALLMGFSRSWRLTRL